MRYDEDERVASCQAEIQRLRRVVWELEDEVKRFKEIARKAFLTLAESESYYPYGEDFKEIMKCIGVTDEEYEHIMED